jgi:acetylglutamate kinase
VTEPVTSSDLAHRYGALEPVVRSSTIVAKLGGSVGSEDTVPEDVALLQQMGARIVLVHGGGPLITLWLTSLGKETRFVKGLRYTDEGTLDVVRMVLGGLVNGEVVARIGVTGARAVGLSGSDDRMLLASIRDHETGLVGEIDAVNTQPIQAVLDAGYIAVIAPLATATDGSFLNVNADTAAGEIAVALKATRYISLTDVDGVSDASGPRRRLTVGDVRQLIDAGVITGGMIPKVEACARALAVADAAHIVDGRVPHVLLESLLDPDATGTTVSAGAR